MIKYMHIHCQWDIKSRRGRQRHLARLSHQILHGMRFSLPLSENALRCWSNFPFLTSRLQGNLIWTKTKVHLFSGIRNGTPSFARCLLTFAKLSLSHIQRWQEKPTRTSKSWDGIGDQFSSLLSGIYKIFTNSSQTLMKTKIWIILFREPSCNISTFKSKSTFHWIFTCGNITAASACVIHNVY